MIGALWAALAGIGFGFFQVFNRKAMGAIGNAFKSTFILLLVSSVILLLASFISADVSLLKTASWRVYVNFGLAGFVHFFLGWTFINISQVRVGAARTGALIGATPLFATLFGLIFFEEYLSLPIIIGIAIVVYGVYVITSERNKDIGLQKERNSKWHDSIFGLGTAICFAFSAVFIRAGLEELDSPLLGVTVGMVISTIAYGIILIIQREKQSKVNIFQSLMLYQILAGVFVGLATWMRWVSLDLAPVGVVMSLGRLNVPVILFVAPLLVGKKEENVTKRIWIGAILTIFGSLILIFL